MILLDNIPLPHAILSSMTDASKILEFIFYGIAIVGVYCIVLPLVLLTLCGLRRLKTPSFCTRPAPHVCTVNGPCNGLPNQEVVKHLRATARWRKL